MTWKINIYICKNIYININGIFKINIYLGALYKIYKEQ